MKNSLMTRIVVIALTLSFMPSRANITSLEHAVEILSELDVILTMAPDVLKDPQVASVLEQIEIFLSADTTLSFEDHDLLSTKIIALRNASTCLPTKAPRIGAQPEQIQINVDERYINPRDEYLRNLIVTGSLDYAMSALTSTSAQFFTGNLFGDVIGTQSATQVVSVCGVPACELARTYSTVVSGTSCNIPSTLVQRDSSGNFVAGSIALQNPTLLTYAAGESECSVGSRMLSAPGLQNLFLGLNSGNPATTGNSNVGVGAFALNSNTTGISNIGVGASALEANTTGDSNVGIGHYALTTNITGGYNVGIGLYALDTNITGSRNTALGTSAGFSAQGNDNIYIGCDVLGDPSDNGVIQIGLQGTQAKTTIAGIEGVTPSTPTGVVIINANGQLGSSASYLNLLAEATSGNIPDTLVLRDANGDFAAGTIMANLEGTATYALDALRSVTAQYANFALTTSTALNALTSTSAQFFTGNLFGDVVGSQSATQVASVCGVPACGLASAYSTVVSATHCNIANRLVQRDASGNFATNSINLKSSTLLSAGGTGDCVTGVRMLSSYGSSIFFGSNAGNPSMGSALGNIGIGSSALGVVTSGFGNTAVGYQNLQVNTTGGNNTAVGSYALQNNINGDSNTSVGFQALQSNTSGSRNVGIGQNANRVNQTANDIVAVGFNALINNRADSSTAVGSTALQANTTGNRNTAVGASALQVNTVAVDGTGIGFEALKSNTANYSTAVGARALQLNTNGSSNTAVGVDALQNNVTGSNNVAVGFNALRNNTGGNNVALGYNAGSALTTGANNICIGYNVTGVAADANTTRIGNGQTRAFIAGIQGVTPPTPTGVVTINSSGQLGSSVTYLNMLNNATNCNTASTLVQRDASGNFIANSIGLRGSTLLTYGGAACAAGSRMLSVPGSNNLFLGENSGNAASGGNNVGVGYQALSSSGSTSLRNVAVGYQALLNNVSGQNNIAIGQGALSASVSANNNTAVGREALNVATGSQNTGLGFSALKNITTGSSNVAIGYEAGVNSTTGGNNIYIGANVTGSAGEGNVIRIGLQGTQSTTIIAGISGATSTGGVQVFINGSGQLGTSSSSQRYKENIQDMGDITQEIYNLRPVVFNYKTDESKRTEYGLIAEEVEEFYPGIVVKNEDGQPETIQYQYLPMMMLNEMKKQHSYISTLQTGMTALQEKNSQLESALAALQMQVDALVTSTPA